MNYTLYLTQASDDRTTVYSYALHNYEGLQASGVFVATGKRRQDTSYCSHIALQRALREAAKMEGVISLKVIVDHPLMKPIMFETMGIDEQKYPDLCRTTNRLLKRFASHELAANEFVSDDAAWQEVAVLDEALDALEQNRTIKGRWQMIRDRFFNAHKTIR
ncbi:hypothetical protein PNF29_04855 [Bacillus subtilis]|uniref:hypothetical protein n=1 Tax=Bacillus subtilis group TaxID=653685 RepID=UPI0011999873|nr:MULTISPECIES: hypothetical protein [Bacillus subtilis group]MCY8797797.1 hypothetical protein [Bacillus inaquosorum]MDL2027818.1 hypothetical protein [Bacillus subtilis]MEC0769217.1 hypothetical protein [Bacillus inaquosorum]MEC0794821.1 hypothetical protein [Bacillus inaquosorum]MED1542125.1 hypothetical protein [Bacillus inaquosorum]